MSPEGSVSRLRVVNEALGRYGRFLWRQVLAWRDDLWILSLGVVLGFILLLPLVIKTVPSGSVGVVWHRFGGGTDVRNVRTEGTVLLWPWNRLHLYDVRLQSSEGRVSALTADGLKVEVDLAWAFYVLPDKVGMVHKGIGPDYRDKVVTRVVESVVRDKISLFKSEELHSPERTVFERAVFTGVQGALARFEAINRLDEARAPRDADAVSVDKGIDWVALEAMLIKEIGFPPAVQEAYVRKNTARALVDEYDFRIAAEQKEVERKMIEALGIRNFQEVVNEGLSESYLKWKGIEANVEIARTLSRSPNAKLVVIGTHAGGSQAGPAGAGGPPIILNTNGLDKAGGEEPARETEPGRGAAERSARESAPASGKAAQPPAR
ncbi:MAG: hypothetical protein RIS35_984 [Pseudomonadota bacterium]